MKNQQETIKMKNAKGFLLRDWVVGIILFGGMVALIYAMAADVGNRYSTQIVTDDFNTKYNNLANSTALTTEMFQNVSGSGGLQLVGTFTSVFASTFKVIQLVFSSLGMAKTTTASIAIDWGIPSVIANIIFPVFVAIITTIIIFGVISLVSRGRV